MKSTGIKTTILQLEQVLAAMLENAQQHHAVAISQYPNEIYKTYDTICVELRKNHAVLSNLADIKYIELGINGIDKEIFYLESRLLELERFYMQANNSDQFDLESIIGGIRADILKLKKKKNELMSTEIDIGEFTSLAEYFQN
jgi:hypothetical protein